MTDREDQREAAAGWVARTQDPAFTDWPAFTAWLEADPARNRAYEEVLGAHDLSGALAQKRAVPDRRPTPIFWRGVAASAALVAVAGGAVSLLRQPPGAYRVETGPGETRAITLADGSVIALNGGSRLLLDRKTPRTATLAYGQADFSIVHDADRPFTVTVGDLKVRDLGTRFDIVRTPGRTEVAVAEGAALFDPDGAAVKLTPGRVIHAADDDSMLELADRDPASIGSWRTGTLLYRDAPLAQVAQDLARASGEPVTVAPDIAPRRFSGGIVVRGRGADRLFQEVGVLLDVQVAHGAAGWRLSSKGRASR